MSSRIAIPLCCLAGLLPTVYLAATVFTPPPGPLATPAQIAAVLAPIPPVAAGETVVDFETAEIGEPIAKWEEKGVTFALAAKLQRTPAAKPQVMFFPHLATGHKGIVNAMTTDQGVPLKMTLPGAGASSVTLVLWGSTGCPAVIEAIDKEGNVVDRQSFATVPARNAPNEPVPFFVVKLKAAAIASVNISGPRSGEYLAADELRFTPLPAQTN
ncbi:MAG: hypothetical protein ABIZ81_03865 [Opitutaceae bacterium]